MTRSRLHRRWRRHRSPYVWASVPTFHPAEERWRRAALGDHVCQRFTVTLP